jgi:hypothetical protein
LEHLIVILSFNKYLLDEFGSMLGPMYAAPHKKDRGTGNEHINEQKAYIRINSMQKGDFYRNRGKVKFPIRVAAVH